MKHFDLTSFKNKKLAFVCSGGVVKAGAWHLGVAMALDELGFHFISNKSNDDEINASSDYQIGTYVGSSAGCMISLYLASGYGPQEIIRSHLNYDKSALKTMTYKDMLSLKNSIQKPIRNDFYEPFESFPKVIRGLLKPLAHFTGFFTTYGLNKYLVENVLISNSFSDYKADIFIVATQLDHSRKVIFSKYNYPSPKHDHMANYYTGIPISEAAAASMSVPPFYAPYPIKNPITNQIDYYIDGEIRDTLSSHAAVDNGCEYIICSWTHTPYHYKEEIGSLINYGLPAICTQSILLMIQKKIMSSRNAYYNAFDLIDTINQYMKDNNFSVEHRKKISQIIETKLSMKNNVRFIDIYPDHDDYRLFFASNFSLSNKVTAKIVKSGYKKTMQVFENAPWEN